ncbi:MAG: hypothetical protein LBC41_08830 [Clostridiales bacterium]|jgi:hypothetical protein|nr:hypothetical protein [Clostridiales bacterium]MDR2750750.1 hypothetical protein [Clostridiales bacterium]
MIQTDSFESIREEFNTASLDKKVQLYVSAEGLTQDQYKDLLKMFPVNELHRLENALQ